MEEIHKLQYNNRTLIYPGYTGYLSFVDSTPTVTKEVLYYDNNTYSGNTGVIYGDDNVQMTRRYCVVMYSISATKSSLLGGYETQLVCGNSNVSTWRSIYYRTSTGVAIPLYYNPYNYTYTPVSGVGVNTNTYDSHTYYYLSGSAGYWPFNNNTATIKFLIDSNTSSSNVRQYVNDSTHNRTLVATGSLYVDSTNKFTLSIISSGTATLTMNNIRVAQFDNEADALAYDGEQTV